MKFKIENGTLEKCVCKVRETEAVIPAGVTSIGEDAFEGCENLTVRAPEGSYAEQYCVENEINVDIQK